MGGTPEPQSPQRQFSPDGMWWWDGAQWRPAISPDGHWHWDGRAWVTATPMAPTGRGGGAGMAVLVTVLVFGGVLVLVTFMTLVILLTMGNQIANVFSNVVAALGS